MVSGKNILVLVVVFAALFLILFNTTQWYFYTQMEDFMEERVSNEVVSLAVSTANQLDPFAVEDLASGNYLLNDLSDVIGTLDNAKTSNSLLSLKLYDQRGKDILASEVLSTHEYDGEIIDVAEFLSASSGIPASTRLLRSDSLYLLAAFAPVFSISDSVVAIVRAEAGYETFSTIEGFKRNVIVVNSVSLLFTVLIVGLFIVVNRRLLKAQQVLLRTSAVSSMGEMAATIAHEIRNPLGIIKNTAERIKTRYAAGNDDPTFEFISDEVDRLNSVVSGYLDFAHPAKGKRERLNLREVVDNLVEQTRTDFSSAGIETNVKSTPPDGSFTVTADRFGIRQAILNIILNAKEAMRNGGRMEISLERTVHRNQGGITISVTDEGAGIPEKLRDRAFDPFFTTREKGSGLGLYVAKNVVDGHGGSIKLDNSKSGGTVVTVFLPERG